jgi:hypothetical protein
MKNAIFKLEESDAYFIRKKRYLPPKALIVESGNFSKS